LTRFRVYTRLRGQCQRRWASTHERAVAISWAKIGAFIKHPLVLLVLGGLLSALLIPQITRQWQDRQSEKEIKRSLLEEISTSATTAIRQGNSLVTACVEPSGEPAKAGESKPVCAATPPSKQIRAAGGEPSENVSEVYAVLRNNWLIRRSTTRSRIITYFPDLYGCWYSYERAIADYLGLVTQYPNSKAVRAHDLMAYVRGDFADTYSQPGVAEQGCEPLDQLPPRVQTRFEELKVAMHWRALDYPTWHNRFKGEYAKLGELLEIGGERIIMTVVKAHAAGFSHGIHIH
jgi:hypothetical protein